MGVSLRFLLLLQAESKKLGSGFSKTPLRYGPHLVSPKQIHLPQAVRIYWLNKGDCSPSVASFQSLTRA